MITFFLCSIPSSVETILTDWDDSTKDRNMFYFMRHKWEMVKIWFAGNKHKIKNWSLQVTSQVWSMGTYSNASQVTIAWFSSGDIRSRPLLSMCHITFSDLTCTKFYAKHMEEMCSNMWWTDFNTHIMHEKCCVL